MNVNKYNLKTQIGGETIKQINQQSGAFCELDRRPPPNPNEKIFIIRGSHEQVELAKRMISEKLGLVREPSFFYFFFFYKHFFLSIKFWV